MADITVTEGLGSIFTRPSEFSDVILVVEGKPLYTSKYVLSLASPVFRTMFTGEFKEKYINEVELPEKKYQDVLDLLLFTRPLSTLKLHATGSLALRLYPLCHEYEMIPGTQRCIEAILDAFKKEIKRRDSTSAAFHRACVQLACKYEVPELYKVCVDVAIDHPASHYDALIDNMKEAPADFQTILATKLKWPVYCYRNDRKFENRSQRASNGNFYDLYCHY